MNEPRFAIIVPYRNRQYNLVHFILNLQWYLNPETFDLIVVEQADSLPFNRGAMLNAGFQLAVTRQTYSHYVLHDVDLIPQEANYSYAARPTHLCAAASQYLYEPPYQDCFGGVVIFNQRDFETVNGYSNHYWGWGREDYDLRCRCSAADLPVERRQGRFLSLPHAPATDLEEAWTKNNERFQILRNRDFRKDGLNSLDYTILVSEEMDRLPFIERIRLLPRPVLWWSVALKESEILPEDEGAQARTAEETCQC